MISKKQSKFIKSLKIKKYRDIENAFIVEGKKNVFELVNSDFEIKYIVCTADFYDENPSIINRKNEVIVSSVAELSQLGTFKTNNECLAVAFKKENRINNQLSGDVTFLLDDIGDPGNLGTIIRTLDWFGFKNLVCSEHCADLYNPKVINSSMGSFTRVGVFYTNLVKFIRENKLPVYGADMNGEELSRAKFPNAAFIVMGSESNGISAHIRSLLTSSISISGFGKAESLNVGVATGILCHHLRSR